MNPPLEHPKRRAFLYALTFVACANACLIVIGSLLFTRLLPTNDSNSAVPFVGTLWLYAVCVIPLANGLLALFCISLRTLVARRLGSPSAGRWFALYALLLCAAAILLNWWMIPPIQATPNLRGVN